MSKHEKSLVGDPIIWPGLVYSPLNASGLLYALGTLFDKAGLIFEEFSDTGDTAVCRRKTDFGWEKINAAFVVNSSQFSGDNSQIDLLICWIDDSNGTGDLPKLELSRFLPRGGANVQDFSPGQTPKEMPDDTGDDFSAGDELRENFEETIRQLDSRIKKLKSL